MLASSVTINTGPSSSAGKDGRFLTKSKWVGVGEIQQRDNGTLVRQRIWLASLVTSKIEHLGYFKQKDIHWR